MKRIATAFVVISMISGCGEPAVEYEGEAAEAAEEVEELQQPSQHFEPAEPPNDAEMPAETDAE